MSAQKKLNTAEAILENSQAVIGLLPGLPRSAANHDCVEASLARLAEMLKMNEEDVRLAIVPLLMDGSLADVTPLDKDRTKLCFHLR